MADKLEYTEVYSKEAYGSRGSFGIKILVHCSPLAPDYKNSERISHACYDAVAAVEKAVMAETSKLDPAIAERGIRNRNDILGLFADCGMIYVEEIPNGYCKDWCCEHLPWFVVTTTIGRIKVGWRKRVISIDWADTVESTPRAEELFPDEDVTKDGKMIHAWSVEIAKSYIDRLFACMVAKKAVEENLASINATNIDHPCQQHKTTLKGGISIILHRSDGKFCISQRTGGSGHGIWQFPGGGVEKGEASREAAARELREECGLEVSPDRFEHLPMCREAVGYKGEKYYACVYAVKLNDGERVTRAEPEKNSEWIWVDYDRLAGLDMLQLSKQGAAYVHNKGESI